MDAPGAAETPSIAALAPARVRAQRLTGWRNTLHTGLNAVLALACAIGIVAGTLEGHLVTDRVTGDVLERQTAGDGYTFAMMLVTCILAVALLVQRGRLLSLVTGPVVAVTSWTCMLLAIGAALKAAAPLFFSLILLPGFWVPGVRPADAVVPTELWPSRVVGAVVLAGLAAGPLLLLTHAVAWLREDALLRRRANLGPGLPATAIGAVR